MTTGYQTRCGLVALLGAPNSGKSTLMNMLVGAKVSIVTPKVQTTRTRILGVVTEDSTQIIYVDTPGVFLPRRRLDRSMVAAAWQGASDADLVAVLIDARVGASQDTQRILGRLNREGREAICVLNKIDLMRRDRLLQRVEELRVDGPFTDFFMISAKQGDGVGDLQTFVKKKMPEGPWLFPEDQLSDMNDRLFAAEVTREKLFLSLHQELPYSLTVETERWEPFRDGSVRIEQVVYVEREAHKGIILGRRGQQIREIRSRAQQDLRAVLDREVHLFLFVKVRGNWTEDPERYRDWGLDYSAPEV